MPQVVWHALTGFSICIRGGCFDDCCAVAELPKTYDPNAVEPKWYQHWLERGYFQADAKSPKPRVLDRHSAAEHHRRAHDGACPEQHDPGHPRAARAHAGARSALAARARITPASPRRRRSRKTFGRRKRRRGTILGARNSSVAWWNGRRNTAASSSSNSSGSAAPAIGRALRYTLDEDYVARGHERLHRSATTRA